MEDFIIIGENIHTTRSVKLDGIRIKDIDGKKVLTYRKKVTISQSYIFQIILWRPNHTNKVRLSIL